MHMQSFDFFMPSRVLFGSGRLKTLHEQKLPGRKALIAISSGGSARRHGYLSTLEHELDLAGVDHVVFEGIRQNPDRRCVMAGAKAARESGCDFVAAIGGGSAMDCAKAIALMMANDGDIWDYSQSGQGGKQIPPHPAAPLVAITTSAGTGSEVDPSGVISNDDTGEKTDIFYESMFPAISVVDPDLMASVPPRFTACQGMDAFFHAAESVVNTKENPVGEMFALKAIELVAKYLPRAYEDGSDREARANVALANTLAGFYMLCTSQHSMEHVMGGFHKDLIHGEGLVMISEAYFGFFAKRKAAELPMVKMARAMGVADAKSGMDFMAALHGLIEAVGCGSLRMSDAGITRDELKLYPRRVHEVLGGDTTADPLPLSDEDYLSIYEESYR